jgi:hypothetical protein
MLNGSLAILPLIAILMARGFRRLQPAGSPPLSWRWGIWFGTTFFAVAFISLGLAALNGTTAPISTTEWFKTVGAVSAIGLIPLGIFLILEFALRLTRKLESSHVDSMSKS